MEGGKQILVLFAVLCIVPLFALYSGYTDGFVALFRPLFGPILNAFVAFYVSAAVFLYILSVYVKGSFSWLFEKRTATRLDSGIARLQHVMSQPRFDALFPPTLRWVPPVYRIAMIVAWALSAVLYASLVAIQLSNPSPDHSSVLFINVLSFGCIMVLVVLITGSVRDDTIKKVEEHMNLQT